LHLYAAALYRRFQKRVVIPSLYIPLPSPFSELESFIHESIKAYHLDLFHCLSTKTKEGVQLAVETVMTPASGIPSQPKKGGGEGMKKALEAYKNKFPHVKGILIGSRKTDPYCGMFHMLHRIANRVSDRLTGKLGFRNPTDQGWPEFMRINPIINWSFSDVWTFLRKLDVPYCSLYDQGCVHCRAYLAELTEGSLRYTSIGSTYNTFKNPALMIQPRCGGHGDEATPLDGIEPKQRYRPAYELIDGTLERSGRGSS
jgi:FAD synthetase